MYNDKYTKECHVYQEAWEDGFVLGGFFSFFTMCLAAVLFAGAMSAVGLW